MKGRIKYNKKLVELDQDYSLKMHMKMLDTNNILNKH